MPAAMLPTYRLSLGSHVPDRSGFPSGSRGAGADKLGFPSAVRGPAACGTFVHCADSDHEVEKTVSSATAMNAETLLVGFGRCIGLSTANAIVGVSLGMWSFVSSVPTT